MVARNQTFPSELAGLYDADETAWLETMAAAIRQGRLDELDYAHLGEYLSDMAKRDRREVESRLAVLLAHLLKWEHQPAKRSGKWRRTIVVQRQKLASLLESGVLHNHAAAILGDAYAKGVRQAVAETELPTVTFPKDCPYSLEQLLADVDEPA